MNELQPTRVLEPMSGLTTFWPIQRETGREQVVLDALTEVLLLEQLHRQTAFARLYPTAVAEMLET